MTAPALELRQVTKRFTLRSAGMFSRGAADHIAVNKVDLTLPRNKVVALVGDNI